MEPQRFPFQTHLIGYSVQCSLRGLFTFPHCHQVQLYSIEHYSGFRPGTVFIFWICAVSMHKKNTFI
jgi:hypothetical protein